jgi:hypothetical protein
VSWVQGGLERGGNSLGGLGPLSEAKIRPRWRQALERGGDFVVWCLALERDGGSPEGCRDWLFEGPLRLFGSWASRCPGPRPRGV